MPVPHPMTIDRALLEKNLVTPEQLVEAGEEAARKSIRIDRALIELGFVDEDDLLAGADGGRV